jgi:hypothetical protein
MRADKKELREAFEDMDYYLRKATAASARIKSLASPYWAARGYTVQPRLEKLRASVFSEEE